MKKEELISASFIDMKEELLVNKQKTSRDIARIFSNELKHFAKILTKFNEEYKTINQNEYNSIIENMQVIFNSSKSLLIDNYEKRFNKNMELLLTNMRDFFMKKLTNVNTRIHYKELDKCINEMCRFDLFMFENQLENNLIDFIDEFSYLYVNSEDSHREFNYLIRNLEHGLVCDIKSNLSSYVSNLQDIVSRYNTQNKEIVNSNPRHR